MGTGRGVLDWEITTLNYPSTPYKVLATPTQIENKNDPTQVEIKLNDLRTATLTVSLFDQAIADIQSDATFATPDAWAYALMLRATYRGGIEFWGQIVTPELDFVAGTVKFSAVGPEARLQAHYVRQGDTALDPANGYTPASDGTAQIPVDYRGMQLLRDAANNTAAQTARGVPDLGIRDGAASTTQSLLMGVHEGDECFSAMQQISGSLLGGPDFEIAPQTAVAGYYADLNCYDKQGADKTATVQLHCGFGTGFLTGMTATPGGKIITHQHAQPQNASTADTSADETSSALRGVWVGWQSVGFNANDPAIQAWADIQVQQYGVPPNFLTVQLPPDDGNGPVYGTDFGMGDVIRVVGSAGHVQNYVIDARIVAARLKQPDGTGTVQTELDLVPNVSNTISTEVA